MIFIAPKKNSHRKQIEIMQKDGSLIELSKVSHLVAALAGQTQIDERFYFPKEMLDPKNESTYGLFDDTYQEFASCLHNGAIKEK